MRPLLPLLFLFPLPLMADVVTAPTSSYFDPPANGTTYVDNFRVVGSYTPASWSWGKIELLEGYQNYRTEGYNLRTQKLRYQDTFSSADYPLQEYYGDLNQQLVDGFNLYYKATCGQKGSALTCSDPGPTRPEARFVLLHTGPNTAKGQCDATRTPVLLVHGAMQTANSWLFPYGNDGRSNPYPGYDTLEGFVQTLERNNFCTYAVTFGNFHGDNFSQATNLSNALDRLKQLTGKPKADVIGWSKGVVSIDVYAANAASWTGWGNGYFEQIAAQQAMAVPPFQDDIRTYVSLTGPHKGIDLNWRHPYDDLLIFSTAENAPVGQGPVVWTEMSAIQCVTFGGIDSPDSPIPNDYAYGPCEGRGGYWTDYWNLIVTSNVTGLDGEGRPQYSKTLESLNTSQGLDASQFSFDKYNISVFGAVDDAGVYRNSYLGQLQVSRDLREYHPIKARNYVTQDWTDLDSDKYNWYDWLTLKLEYNPYSAATAGWMDSDLQDCRETAYDPAGYPCLATHKYIKRKNAVSVAARMATYKVMDSLGIDVSEELSGGFQRQLEAHGLSKDLDYLLVLNGTRLGPSGTNFEIDGLDCPDCDPNGDAVLFEESIGQAAYDQLTQGWTADQKTCRSSIEALDTSHLEAGVDPAVWTTIMNRLRAMDTQSCRETGALKRQR